MTFREGMVYMAIIVAPGVLYALTELTAVVKCRAWRR